MKLSTRIAVAVMMFGVAALAAENPIFSGYEAVRQSLLKANVPAIQSAAATYAATAHAAGQHAVAAKAEALAKAKDLAGARTAFAALSDEVIKVRAALKTGAPIVAYCPMEKKSWLQPKGEISNPYVDASMRTCGEVKK